MRVAVDEMLPRALLNKALNKTSALLPDLRIELINSSSEISTSLVEHKDVDVAISSHYSSNIYCQELCKMELILAVNTTHPLNSLNRELKIEELNSHRQIVLQQCRKLQHRNLYCPNDSKYWTANNLRLCIDMVIEGMGYAWLPLATITKELNTGTLTSLDLFDKQARMVSLYLLHGNYQNLEPEAQAFLKEVQKQFSSGAVKVSSELTSSGFLQT
nr:substrate-binding domain-containing protein [Pseudoalteromonas arctica]